MSVTGLVHGAITVCILVGSVSLALAQQVQDGKGKSCGSVNRNCYKLGGSKDVCEPKFQQCLQTGTYSGNRYTITNLKKQ